MDHPPGQHPRHGGDLAGATARFGAPAEGWLDLSTGVNPHAYPFDEIASSELTRLPDPAALDRLLAAARRCYNLSPEAALVAVPGSEIAIRLLPLYAVERVPSHVAIVGATYGSHAETWRAGGAEVATVDHPRAGAGSDVIVVCNPNNPDGRTFPAQDLADAAATATTDNGRLVVDEAFADLDPANSLLNGNDGAGPIVLRSFGKFFGLPGLRLGFVAGPAAPLARLRAHLGDWPVSGQAIEIGRRALSDTAWQTEMRARLASESEQLVDLLISNDLAPVGGTNLFQLVEHADAETLHAALAMRGVLTRFFPGTHRLRIGLPADKAAFERFSGALAASL